MTKWITCLFLGSGLSKELAGIPSTHNFLGEVLKEGRDRWIDECGLAIGDEALSSWMRRVGDLELCLSYLHQVASGDPRADDPASSHKIPAIQTIINVRAAIADYLGKIEQRATPERQELQERFFHKFIRGDEKNLVILTTNYDLVTEALLSEHKTGWCYREIPIADGGRIYSHDRGGTFESHAKEIPLYKLHGSINWLEERWFDRNQPAKDVPLKSIHPAQVYIPQKPMHRVHQKWAYLFKMGKKTYNPILIPFVFQKVDWLEDGRWKEVFQPHWNDAEKNLFNKNLRIFFLGYRLAAADYYMLPWLLMILGKAKKAEVTVISKGNREEETLKNVEIREPLERALYPFIHSSNVFRSGLKDFLSRSH